MPKADHDRPGGHARINGDGRATRTPRWLRMLVAGFLLLAHLGDLAGSRIAGLLSPFPVFAEP